MVIISKLDEMAKSVSQASIRSFVKFVSWRTKVFPVSELIGGGDPFVCHHLCGEIRTLTNSCGVAREKDIGQSLFCIELSSCCFVMG